MLVFLLYTTTAIAQQTNQFPIDTSYTVSGTYVKLRKNYPFIKPVYSSSPQGLKTRYDIVYKTIEKTPFGKRQLHADVFMPRDTDKAYPALVMVHGGGWRAGNKSLNNPMAEQIALHGFVVISVEYRLSLEAKYPAAINDIKTCVRWIRENAEKLKIDTTRIAIAGSSAGGQLASLIGATNGNDLFEDDIAHKNSSSDVQAVIDLDGLLDFTDNDNLEVKRNEKSADVSWLDASYQDNPERWREASAVTWVSRSTPPFLFINSSQKRFHAGYEQMVAKLNAFGIHSHVITLQDAPHSYWLFHPWFEPTVDYITNFLHTVFRNSEK
jgi:acetyl esterase/lipase